MATYIHKNGQQYGPFEDAQILAYLRDHTFGYQDLGWRDDSQDWQPLEILFPKPAATVVIPPRFPPSKEKKSP